MKTKKLIYTVKITYCDIEREFPIYLTDAELSELPELTEDGIKEDFSLTYDIEVVLHK